MLETILPCIPTNKPPYNNMSRRPEGGCNQSEHKYTNHVNPLRSDSGTSSRISSYSDCKKSRLLMVPSCRLVPWRNIMSSSLNIMEVMIRFGITERYGLQKECLPFCHSFDKNKLMTALDDSLDSSG